MKITFFIFAIIVITFIVFTIKTQKNTSIEADRGITQGTVTKVFYRGKLPFCVFEYKVKEVIYSKKQEITKRDASRIIHKNFEVWYQNTKPQNALLKIKL